MKKFLAILLTVATLMSCMIFSVSAAGDDLPDEVSFNSADAGIGKWVADTNEKKEGEASATRSFSANSTLGTAGMNIYFSLENGVDISNYSKLVFDLYVSDPSALEGVRYEIELSSSGSPLK